MLIEVPATQFRHHFPSDPHPFISERFLELNVCKVDRIVRLIEEKDKPSMGLAAGLKDGKLKSHFSAPFGGFHFKNESIYSSGIDDFINALKEYAQKQQISEISITLPPFLYGMSFNSKAVNSFIRCGFSMSLPDLTNWVELTDFNGRFSHRNSREYYQQALRNNLIFMRLEDKNQQIAAFDLICQNRAQFGRPIYMTYNDIMNVGDLWPVDFFGVYNQAKEMVASAVFYRFESKIAYAVFWGDNESGRPLRAMDLLVIQLWSHYKSDGFRIIDLGISTESGIPNEGLLRFKETHECKTSLKYTFTWLNR